MPRASDALRSMMLSASTVETPPRVGVVGAGLMGLGVAQAFAATGARVVLCGRDQDAALRGRARLQAVLLRQVARGRLAPDDGAAILLRVESSTVVDGLRECDLVIESVPEDQFRSETPFRHRLRLDTYSHYRKHADAIRKWRAHLEKKR